MKMDAESIIEIEAMRFILPSATLNVNFSFFCFTCPRRRLNPRRSLRRPRGRHYQADSVLNVYMLSYMQP